MGQLSSEHYFTNRNKAGELHSVLINDMEKETTSTLNNHIDYKDITRLGAQVNPHARIMSRRRTGFTAKGQRNLALAIKRARFMALIPYIKH